MAGLWEGVPASPCSAVSDEPPMRSSCYSESILTRKKTLAANSHTLESARRTRMAPKSCSPPLPPHIAKVGVGFVEASSCNHGDSDLVAKLNFSAADERRKRLLQRLRAIDAKKAQLEQMKCGIPSKSAPSVNGPAVSQESLNVCASPSTESLVHAMDVIDMDSFEAKKAMRRFSRRSAPISNVSSPSMTDRGCSIPPRSPGIVLDISSVNAADEGSRMTLDRFVDTCRSPSPTVTTMCISSTPSVSPLVDSTPVSSADAPTRTRSSRRITRPRTPSVLLQGFPGENCSIPTGISRCKRLQFCKKVISLLLRNSSASPFSAPVKELWPAESIPRYFDVISKPMDLRTVKRNLDTTHYIHTEERSVLHMFDAEAFAEDVRLVFRNAMVYNNEGDMLYNCAKELMEEFEHSWRNLPEPPAKDVKGGSRKRATNISRKTGPIGKRSRASELASTKGGEVTSPPRKKAARGHSTAPASKIGEKVGAKKRKQVGRNKEAPRPSSALVKALTSTKQVRTRLDYLRKCRVAVQARGELPRGAGFMEKAALIYDVPMSFAEKNRISEGIRKLPSGKLDVLVNLIRDAMGENADGGNDEIELDINQLNNETLRNIEAYLESCMSGYKTVRSLDIGKEFCSGEEIDDEIRLLELRLQRSKAKASGAAKIADKPRPFFDRSSQGLYPSSSESSSDEESDSSDGSSASDSDSD